MAADAGRTPRPLCSTEARTASEDPIATAEPVRYWVAVEYRGVWGRNPIEHAKLPEPVRARLIDLGRRTPRTRVVFIRREGPQANGVQLFIARTTESRPGLWSARVATLDDVATFPFEDYFDAEAPPSEVASPLALVCTHGQHDPCCGLRGYPVYEALARAHGHVWQCSHVGGDRFAANVVVLPSGVYYARVEPGDADDIAATLRENRISLPHYRGRSCYGRYEQVIEAVVRRQHGLTGVDDVQVLDVESPRPSYWLGHARDGFGRVHTVEVVEGRSEELGFLTCAAKRQEPRRVYEVVRCETE
ncbi:MAG TPA: sucrase ferredoxin [Thermoanaerobaculia bacterium]|nr:sucrase ferredoxin [Thermoanaerobaculia bacterium]